MTRCAGEVYDKHLSSAPKIGGSCLFQVGWNVKFTNDTSLMGWPDEPFRWFPCG
ncbi:hypothetical protein [Prevotella jejuni]|uniref:hypothetical protein n=1 Tax=Prevotella jejuni TaxID=1177574 RepID=UPI0028F0FC54|nr:hypothetical protein [Prevotella jejuni]